ncbi:hypothetical protein Tcan_03838 [Toxocara canis]|nr:hypothetical protein Tcan_03838 [Toxocara canis]
MEKELATLSFDLNVHRCLDCSTVNRKTMRAILMMALLAARPHICEFGSTSDLRFDDDLHKTSITATLSMPDISHRRSHKKTTIKKIFNNTTPINKLCNLQ